jgi:hypothetical protein
MTTAKKSAIFWDVTPCSLYKFTGVAVERIASIFRVKDLRQPRSQQACRGGVFDYFLLDLFLHHEDGGRTFHRNVG